MQAQDNSQACSIFILLSSIASQSEEDLLDKAWGLEQRSRLSCQIILDEDDLEIEIPKYNINMVSENPH